MGKTAEQIEKRYGEFDFKFASYSGYKINQNFVELINTYNFDNRYKEVYYYVQFRADGKVCRIDRGPNPRVWN